VRGILITLEGIDGSGKTTALRIFSRELVDAFPRRHFVFTAEPTLSQAGKILRSVHLSGKQASEAQDVSAVRRMEELFLFMADHANHLAETVVPALGKGDVVISDRYADSTAAYQGITLRGIVPDPVQWIRDLYRPWNIIPDRTLLFALDSALAVQRIRSRSGTDSDSIIEKFEREEFLQEVDKNFRLLAKSEPERFALIDADRGIEDVAGDALEAIVDIISQESKARSEI
jgi:dTMP kinase